MKLVLLFLALLSGSIDKISSFTITDIRTDRGGEIERPASTDAGGNHKVWAGVISGLSSDQINKLDISPVIIVHSIYWCEVCV